MLAATPKLKEAMRKRPPHDVAGVLTNSDCRKFPDDGTNLTRADLSPDKSSRSAARNSATSTARSTTSEARATVEAAWAAGIRFFDTAPHYGLGLSERRLGAALAGRAARRVRHLDKGRPAARAAASHGLSTTAGSPCRPTTGASGTSAATACGGRWRTASSGWGSTGWTWCCSMTPTTTATTRSRRPVPRWRSCARRALVRAIGAGMNQSAMLADFARETDVDVLLVAGRYTLLEQVALDDLLPVCADPRRRRHRGRRVQQRPARPAEAARRLPPTTTGRRPPSCSTARRASRTVCERHGVSLPAAALAFPGATRPSPASSSAPTARAGRAQHRRSASTVPDDLWVELKAEGLLRRDAPVPAV